MHYTGLYFFKFTVITFKKRLTNKRKKGILNRFKSFIQ